MNAEFFTKYLIEYLIRDHFRLLDLPPYALGYLIIHDGCSLQLFHASLGYGILRLPYQLLIECLDEFDVHADTRGIRVFKEDSGLPAGTRCLLEGLKETCLHGVGEGQVQEVIGVTRKTEVTQLHHELVVSLIIHSL